MICIVLQAEIAAGELGENPLAPTEVLKELEDGPEEPAGPTMMSKEARQLMLSGQGQAGLQAWKVSFQHVIMAFKDLLLPSEFA